MKKIAFVVNYGVEYRNFFLSKLNQQLSLNNQTLIFCRKGIEVPIKEYIGIKAPVVSYGQIESKVKRGFWENIFLPIRKYRMELKGVGTFKNYNDKKRDSYIRKLIFGNFFAYNVVRFFSKKEIASNYVNTEINELYVKHQITDIFLANYSSVCSIAFATNALAKGIRVWLIINSWKDIYINDFIPFKPKGIFVWSDLMKNNYLDFNGHITRDLFYSVGNPVFDRFYKYTPNRDRAYYESKYNLKVNDEYIIYTMLDPKRYPSEIEVVDLLSKATINLSKDSSRLKIIIRKNPFDNTEIVNHHFKANSCVIVAEHYSFRDEVKDVFVQSIEGETEWIDLLYYSKLNVGVASTVALESLILNKPVLTVSFNKNGLFCPELDKLNSAPFFKDLYNRDDVKLVKSIDEFKIKLKEVISNQQSSSNINCPDIIVPFKGDSVSRVSRVINDYT